MTRARLPLVLMLLASVAATLPATTYPRAAVGGSISAADALFLESLLEEEAPEDLLLFGRTVTGAPATAGAFERAGAERAAALKTTRAEQPRLLKPRWRFRGPVNIGARVVDLVADPKLRDTLYAAAASGGVWRSRDGGMTYRPIWPLHLPQSMGALTMGPDGALWAGTGEANPGGGSLTYGGGGVFVSRDRGKTWRNTGLTKVSRIGRIAVDPKDPKHVFVAATGHLFAPGGDRGLYETRNGGRTWRLALAGDNPTTGAVDVAIDPQNPDNVLATMWDAVRYPDRRVYTGVGSGVYRSTDGGRTFARLGLLNGLPPALPNIGRIGVAFAPSDPSRAYAIYANNELGAYQAFFVSLDGGATWVGPPTAQASLAQSQSVYGWWFGRVFVDPKDPLHVFVTGLTLSESIDGGLSFPAQHADIHVDHHAMAWDPFREDRLWNGNDGGVYRSDANGSLTSWEHARVMPWNQFFTIDVSQQDPSRINGGVQDNGSLRSWGGQSGWDEYNGGDGVKNVINPLDHQNVFACSQYGSCVRSDDGGESTDGMSNSTVRNGWLTPIEFEPGSKDVMYWAGDRVHRSVDRGRSWEPISPDLGKGEAGGELNPLYAAHYGTTQALGLSADDPAVIYAGTDNGYLWKTTDGGESWSEIVSETLPDRWMTSIAVDQRNADRLFVSYSGFREADESSYVFTSTDGGSSWRDVSANLPAAPVNDLVLVGGTLYAATDVGVYVTKPSRLRWYRLGSGLPNCPINDLRYVAKTRSLYAGTFGRGVYSIVPPSF